MQGKSRDGRIIAGACHPAIISMIINQTIQLLGLSVQTPETKIVPKHFAARLNRIYGALFRNLGRARRIDKVHRQSCSPVYKSSMSKVPPGLSCSCPTTRVPPSCISLVGGSPLTVRSTDIPLTKNCAAPGVQVTQRWFHSFRGIFLSKNKENPAT